MPTAFAAFDDVMGYEVRASVGPAALLLKLGEQFVGQAFVEQRGKGSQREGAVLGGERGGGQA